MGNTPMSLSELSDMLKTEEKPPPCKGLVFRGYVNNFFSGGKIEMSQGLRLLKRKSCPGCMQCGSMLDDLHEFMCDEGIIMPDIEPGKLYGVRVTNLSRDYESGYVDSWDVEAYKLEEPDEA